MTNSTVKLAPTQLTLLLITLVGATALLFAPAMSIRAAGQDAWLALLLVATIYGLLVVWVTAKLPVYYPGLGFGQYTAQLLGKWPAKLLSLLYFIYIGVLLLVIVREFGSFLNAAFMPETPIVVFNLSLLLLAIFATTKGLEVIARMNEFIFPLLLLTMVLMFALLTRDVEPARLLPFLDEGPMPVLKGSQVPAAFRGEVFILMWLVNHLEKPRQGVIAGAWAVIFLALVLAIDVIATLTIMGKELAAKEVFPTLLLARYTSIGNFINRVEGVIMVIWVAGVTIKCSALFFIAIQNMKDSLGLTTTAWYLTFPIGAVILAGSQHAFTNDSQLLWFMQNILPPASLVFQLLIPTLLLLMAWVKKGRGSHPV